MKQFIYARDTFQPLPTAGFNEDVQFHCCRFVRDLWLIRLEVCRFAGRSAFLKMAIKILLGRRLVYFVIRDAVIQHYGWVSLGFCKYYRIERDSAVIGPMATIPSCRGQRIASMALQMLITSLATYEGVQRVYIDTSEDNIPMQKVIRNCGFNILAGTYVRYSDQKPGQAFKTRLKRLLPASVLRGISCLRNVEAINRLRWKQEYDSVVNQARQCQIKQHLPCLGIVKDVMQRHSYYEAACLELGIPFQVIDITGPDWVDLVEKTKCAAYLVRPYVLKASWKRLYDDRVRIMSEELGKMVYPSVKSLWLYESKRRGSAWLTANHVPHPQTWCFDDYGRALAFAETCSLPILFKTDLGSESTGVKLLRTRRQLIRLVRRAFKRGIGADGYDRDRHVVGELLLQEFIPDAREWRMVRIGNSYFGHRKGKVGDFHSGSKIIEFDDPPERLLRFVKSVTDKGPFDNMALDILETTSGDYRVIELHCYFGCNSPDVMQINGIPGRYQYDSTMDAWAFEAGDFNRNASCNLRVDSLLKMLSSAGGVE